MAIVYRFELKLSSVGDGRQQEVIRFLQNTNRGTGPAQWRETLEALEGGKPQIIFSTNSLKEAKRVVNALHQHGGTADIIDLVEP